ncbi:MAG: CHAT domain-containing protein [Oscillatoriaceae cyanobacterium Prado104]|jgi:filamentous hemagglutinin family protein|nr:CHAT domain-containing protein [Oscillatoriaceae cyanobacterium Prado104]
MNAKRAVRSVLAAIPIAGFWMLDCFPHLLVLQPNSSRWSIVAIYRQSQIAAAQSIVSAPDGTGTAITPGPQTGLQTRYDITGGTTSRDGANLFHSFTRFNLNAGDTANFISNPTVQNILGRVVGGDASLINGLIQVSGGNANLFLINPAGIIFGNNARLDVSGSFLAATASGIGFDNRWFSSTGTNDYASLVGSPNVFAFGPQPGSIVNAGELAVNSGENLTLLGGTVISTGELSAPGGQITVAAVPGEHLVRLSQNGLLLNLEVSPSRQQSGDATLPFSPLTLPRLLAGAGVEHATGITANDRGELVLTGDRTVDGTIPIAPATAIVSGTARVSATAGTGGTVNVLGDKVGLVGSRIEANGPDGGGTVRVGGDYRGAGTVPNASVTYVDGTSTIAADATKEGNGGNVVIWADNTAAFLGSISARGVSAAANSGGGTGGFVEVSGKQSLIFSGTVDTSGTNGLGTLLIDPENILITDSEPTQDNSLPANSSILATGNQTKQSNSSGESLTISARSLESMSATANVLLEALNDIKIADLADGQLSFQATTGSIIFKADADRSGAGAFSMNVKDTISTNGGAISISGYQITTGNLSSNGGNIILTSQESTAASSISSSNSRSGTSGNILLEGLNLAAEKIDASGDSARGNIILNAQNRLEAGSVTAGSGNILLTGNEIDLKGGSNSISGSGFLVLQPGNPGQNIAIGSTGDIGTNTFLNLTASELESLQNGFAGITIGRNNGTGAILIANDFTAYDPLTLQSPANSGTITTTRSLTGADNASITLKADGNIRTGNISTKGQEIRLASNSGDITTGQLHTGTAAPNNSQQNSASIPAATGDVSITAAGKVTAGSIDTRGERPGNVTLTGRGGVSVGAIEAGGGTGGNITLTGSEIDLTGARNSVSSNGNLVLQPADPRQDITINSPGNTEALDLTAAELNALRNGFSSIAIGRSDGSGTITIAPPTVTFQDPTTIQSPAGTGTIAGTGAIAGTDNAAITLIGGSVSVGDVTSTAGINITSSRGSVTTGTLSSRTPNGEAGDISIRSAGAVVSGNVNAFGASGGGDISISASGRIGTGVINSSSQSGNAGSSTLTGQKDIEVTSIKARGNTGGDVEIAAGGAFRVTGTGTEADRATSISTDGRDRSGSLTLVQSTCKSGNCTLNPFGTANAQANGGTSSSIAVVPSPASQSVELKLTETSGVTRLTLVPAGSEVKNSTANVAPETAAGATEVRSIETSGGSELVQPSQPKDAPSANGGAENGAVTIAHKAGNIRVPEIARSSAISQINPIEAVQQNDRARVREFENYFGKNLDRPLFTQQSIRDTLSSVSHLGVKPAIVYVWAKADRLELVLLLPDGKNIFKTVPVNRETVLQVAREFTNAVRSPKRLNSTDYKESAEQLYQWSIAPLQPELEANKINTLVFSMDAGLRTLPLAALFDGKNFLVEKYSLALIPSLSLTDTRYAGVKAAEVLAMGASKFPEKYDQNPLPAVPLELSTIVGKLWPGSSFLNEKFTLGNLKTQRDRPQYKIIHLATHGDFQPGGAENSYIQFWDTKLRLDQLDQLKLSNPQVELLVLSACTTAVGDEQAELGFAGLAFQAGVKSAVASLWYVSDSGTLGLMTEFYQQLRTAPIKAEALRQAQLALLRGEVRLQDGYLQGTGSDGALQLPAELAQAGDRNLSHPYYWAAFTTIGSPW